MIIGSTSGTLETVVEVLSLGQCQKFWKESTKRRLIFGNEMGYTLNATDVVSYAEGKWKGAQRHEDAENLGLELEGRLMLRRAKCYVSDNSRLAPTSRGSSVFHYSNIA